MPPHQTNPSPHPLLRPNDLELLRLFATDFLLLSRQQIHELFPGQSVRNLNFRLHKLTQLGYLSCRLFPAAVPAFQIYLYHLGHKAAHALMLDPADTALLSRRKHALRLRDGAIPHLMLVTSVHIRFFIASREYPDYKLLSWVPGHSSLWHTLNDYGFPLRPDAYAEFQKDAFVVRFFLELDRGTEHGHIIQTKLTSYYDYLVSERFQQHFSAPSFRVLFITPSPRRAHHLFRHIDRYPTDLFWVTSIPQFLPQPLGNLHWRSSGSDTPQSLMTPL